MVTGNGEADPDQQREAGNRVIDNGRSITDLRNKEGIYGITAKKAGSTTRKSSWPETE
jgi:hypothetical protein